MYGGLATAPPISQTCDYCGWAFAAVSPAARFCCDKHRTAYWKVERKRKALVDLLMEHFKLADVERSRLMAVVRKVFAKFCKFAEWLGYRYRTKKYVWIKA